MLEEEGGRVEGVEGYAVGSVVMSIVSNLLSRGIWKGWSLGVGDGTYSFTKSNCSFFGSISSIYGSNLGYSSRTFERMARWALDLTFDFAPEVMLGSCQSLSLFSDA